MAADRIPVIDDAAGRAYGWLADVMNQLVSDDRERAFQALRSTLHALRDRLPLQEVAHLGAQLPILIRGLYYEAWRPSPKPAAIRSREDFLGLVAHYHARPRNDLEELVRAVFAVLDNRISRGEIGDIKHVLPRHVRELWPELGFEES